jgi:putative protein-disulfide isomerase
MPFVNRTAKLLLLLLLCSGGICMAQKSKKMEKKNNPLLCDPKTGICELPAAGTRAGNTAQHAQNNPVKLIYFTDPICSSCWGIEPQLRRLKLEYGNTIQIEYHMGGLLPDWSYNSGGISKPSDVATHWDEVSPHYQMPIDGDVWLEDPLPSSYPPSIAFKAAQLQDNDKAVVFMRLLREMVFLKKKNITRWEYMAEAATIAGLDTNQLKQDYEGKAKELFQQDLELARKMGVRGFPTIFVTNQQGKVVTVYGSRPYTDYVSAITSVYPAAIKEHYATTWQNLFTHYPTLTTREFAELSNISIPQAEATLKSLTTQGHLQVLATKNGPLWIKK